MSADKGKPLSDKELEKIAGGYGSSTSGSSASGGYGGSSSSGSSASGKR